MQVMKQQIGHAEVQQNGCGALASMAVAGENKVRIIAQMLIIASDAIIDQMLSLMKC